MATDAKVVLDIHGAIDVLSVGPTDRIVVHVKQRLDYDHALAIRVEVARAFGIDAARVVVMDSDATLSVVNTDGAL